MHKLFSCFLVVFLVGCTHVEKTGKLTVLESFDSSGKLTSEVRYDQDQRRQGMFIEYYPSGVFKRTGHYKDDKLDGIIRELREDGTLKTATEYHLGEIDGMHNIYYPNEAIWTKEIYDHGKVVKRTEFDELGEVLGQEYFY